MGLVSLVIVLTRRACVAKMEMLPTATLEDVQKELLKQGKEAPEGHFWRFKEVTQGKEKDWPKETMLQEKAEDGVVVIVVQQQKKVKREPTVKQEPVKKEPAEEQEEELAQQMKRCKIEPSASSRDEAPEIKLARMKLEAKQAADQKKEEAKQQKEAEKQQTKRAAEQQKEAEKQRKEAAENLRKKQKEFQKDEEKMKRLSELRKLSGHPTSRILFLALRG